MGLFKVAESTSAYAKIGILGFAGSGKTYTASQFAIGLQRASGGTKPVDFIDTETGSDWVVPSFKEAGVPLRTAKTRAFTDLLEAVDESEKTASVLIIDSISHFWKEFLETYCREKAAKKNRATYDLSFPDWAFLKTEWSRFTDRFINSSLHIIMCGRAGYEYDFVTDDNGKKQLEKTDIKMKAENELGYEPSLLILMTREMDMKTQRQWRTAQIIKDRSTKIDGKEFINPTFNDIKPFVDFLNLGGTQMGVDTSRNSSAIIPHDERDRTKQQVEIALGEIKGILMKHFPGSTADEKKKKGDLVLKHFNVYGWEAVEARPLTDLRNGLDSLSLELEGKKYYGE